MHKSTKVNDCEKRAEKNIKKIRLCNKWLHYASNNCIAGFRGCDSTQSTYLRRCYLQNMQSSPQKTAYSADLYSKFSQLITA